MIKITNGLKVPKLLYKYRNLVDRFHIKLITDQEMYLAEPNSFNDPFDCKIPTRWDLITEEEMEERNQEIIKMVTQDHNNQGVRDFLLSNNALWKRENIIKPGKEYFDKISNLSGIISLTSKKDNNLMWSHYAMSHTGFCIGFDSQTIMGSGFFDYIGKVSYSKKFPLILPKMSMDQRYYIEMFSKSYDWSYEDEYRITKRHMEKRTVILPKLAIKEVILGCRFIDEEKHSFCQLINENLPHVKIFQAQIMEDKFALEIVEIG